MEKVLDPLPHLHIISPLYIGYELKRNYIIIKNIQSRPPKKEELTKTNKKCYKTVKLQLKRTKYKNHSPIPNNPFKY